jgi:predicted RecB family nuclease
MMGTKITREVLESALLCPMKAHLNLSGESGPKSDLETYWEERRVEFRRRTSELMIERYRGSTYKQDVSITGAELGRGTDLILNAVIENDLVSLRIDGLKKVAGASRIGDFHYAPILFIESDNVRREHRQTVEVIALILGEVQGRQPDRAVLVFGRQPRSMMLRIRSTLQEARKIFDGLKSLRVAEKPPELMLNRNCQTCEFRGRCEPQAAALDDLSLMRGMGEKEIKKLKRRGIFTVTQLSCTYRPRKKIPSSKQQKRGHSFALQALAIREGKTYVIGQPKMPGSPVRIYFDIEGDPERNLDYLLGMIVEDNGEQTRFSFWADGEGQEGQISKKFLEVVGLYPDCRLVCYGSYELSFLKRAMNNGKQEALDDVLSRTTNLLSLIYNSFYFPVYHNGLKEIASLLGFRWTEEGASGIRSIVWRRRWEDTGDETLKQKLLTYNLDDCAALQTVTRFIEKVISGLEGSEVDKQVPESVPDYSRVEEYVIPTSRREWCTTDYQLPDFDFINGLAYFDYQRERVFIRNSKAIKRSLGRQKRGIGKRRTRFDLEIVVKDDCCSLCQGVRLTEEVDGRLKRLVSDLRITPNGIKSRTVRVVSPRQVCLDCGTSFAPTKYFRIDRFSHSLKSWAMYEHVAHRLSFGNLAESLRECFGVKITYADIHGFKFLMAQYYQKTYDGLVRKLVAGNLIHADETEAEVRDAEKSHVWVFTNLEEVVYIYRPNREGDFLRELLDGFNGVLVSDFYAAYDSLPCAQQKCLIHLIRDINQDIIGNPFDVEMKGIASDFGRLLREIVTTIDRRGLSKIHLAKHRRGVAVFLGSVKGQSYQSEIASSYQKRFEKCQHKLFTFLDYDGVPWNNNNAEHAIKTFAYYREIAGGMFSESGLRDYLVLLSLYQTCVYKGVSFLKFLVSQARDIDAFSQVNRRRNEVLPYDLYPEGFVPPRRRKKRDQPIPP